MKITHYTVYPASGPAFFLDRWGHHAVWKYPIQTDFFLSVENKHHGDREQHAQFMLKYSPRCTHLTDW